MSFKRYKPGEHGLVGDYFFSVAEDKSGYLWISGRSGLLRFDGSEFENYTSLLSHSIVRNIYIDSHDLLWVSTNNGLNRLDPRTDAITIFTNEPSDPHSISDNRPEPVLDDGEGNIWIGTQTGLNSFDTATESFRQYLFDERREEAEVNRYYCIIHDNTARDILWLGSGSGLQKFNKSTGHFTKIPLPEDTRKANKEPIIFGLYQHDDGVLWLALNGLNAVVSYSPESGNWQTYDADLNTRLTPNREMASYFIMRRSANELWVSMVPGVGSLNTATGIFSWLDLDNNSPNTAFASAARHLTIDSRGYLWIPSLMGISRSMKPVTPVTETPRKVGIVFLKIDGHETRVLKAQKNSIDIGYDEDSLELQYRLVNPEDPKLVEYAYRLLGIENSWMTSDSGYVLYSDLRPGNYFLELKAREPGRPWSDVSGIQLKVEAAWWQSPVLWISGIALVLIVVLSFVLIQQMHKRREKALKTEYEMQMAQVQMEALRSQMNPHFLFNTMNSINHFILKNDRKIASSYLTKFSRLIRLVLNHSRAELVKLTDELEALKLYIQLEQLRFEKQFQFDMLVEPNIDPDTVTIPPLLIQPYVENSIWHGLMQKDGPGRLSVNISREQEQLIISIKDNGIGRVAAKQYQASLGKTQSFGTKITQNRINLVNHLYGRFTEVEITDLHDHAGNSTGTEVILTIPILAQSRNPGA